MVFSSSRIEVWKEKSCTRGRSDRILGKGKAVRVVAVWKMFGREKKKEEVYGRE